MDSDLGYHSAARWAFVFRPFGKMWPWKVQHFAARWPCEIPRDAWNDWSTVTHGNEMFLRLAGGNVDIIARFGVIDFG